MLIFGVTVFWDGSDCIISSIVAMVEPGVWGLAGKGRACVFFPSLPGSGIRTVGFPLMGFSKENC